MRATTYPAAPASVPAARRFVLDELPDVDAGVRDRIALIVSELATNAVVYGATEFEICVEITDGRIHVVVNDQGPGTPILMPLPPASAEHGRGLRIVKELSDEWGIDGHGNQVGKSIWFKLALNVDGDGTVSRRADPSGSAS